MLLLLHDFILVVDTLNVNCIEESLKELDAQTENGIFDKATAAKFRALLEAGGKEHPMDLYVKFRGHKPQTKALIDQMGLGK